ncbi:MAG TPA: ComEA family DNA-binding protein [Candidatus Hydrogenedentes bacterium]|nr:ComEA family DNA-binding protein [Candidatus Hydrogenedentota bacterium]
MGSVNRMLTRREQATLLFVAGALVLGVIAAWWLRNTPDPDAQPKPEAGAVQEAAVPSTGHSSVAPAEPASSVTPAPPSSISAPPASAAQPAPAPPSGSAENASDAAPNTQASTIPLSEDSARDLSGAASETVAVAVRGGIIQEGLYRMPAGSRVADLIAKAGGTRSGADLSTINLAAPLVDGTTLTIPLTPEAAQNYATANPASAAWITNPVNPSYYLVLYQPDGMAHSPSSAPVEKTDSNASGTSGNSAAQTTYVGAKTDSRINLNTATQAELEQLPGIGPKLAQQIIAFREKQPFTRIEDLDAVPGFGPKRIEAIRDLVTVP